MDMSRCTNTCVQDIVNKSSWRFILHYYQLTGCTLYKFQLLIELKVKLCNENNSLARTPHRLIG